MNYYKLLDPLNCGEVVREDGGRYDIYCFGREQWLPSDIMTPYLEPGNGLWGCYMEISGQTARALLDRQRRQLDQLLKQAIAVATLAHAGQVDKGGHPYILHPAAVAAGVESTEQKIIAYLHDVVEDTPVTLEDLSAMGFSNRIVHCVGLLTRAPGVSYEDYLRPIRLDWNARRVKLADLRSNMDISRIPHPTRKDYDRLEKYRKALAFLEEE